MPGTGYFNRISIIAATAAIMVFSSCKQEVEVTPMDMEKVPTQEVTDMEVLRSENGIVSMRMTSPLMQHFDYVKDSVRRTYDLYPKSIHLDVYTEDGALETVVDADNAEHITTNGSNLWIAYGNVVVVNLIEKQKIESDTIYWNQRDKLIYNNCYVKVTTPSSFLQGYGMVSDERAKRTTIMKPFDSFSGEDTTGKKIDTLNFVGPLRKPFATKDTLLKEK